MRMFSWYTDKVPYVSTYSNGAPKKRYLVLEGIAVVGRAVMHYKPNMKGGHRHNHVRNARFRGNVCPYCDGIIAKGCGERRYDGVLFCTECAQADYEERCDRAEYLSHIYG